jgi:hypothetical protein
MYKYFLVGLLLGGGGLAGARSELAGPAGGADRVLEGTCVGLVDVRKAWPNNELKNTSDDEQRSKRAQRQ